ncbi:hypothetical protein SEA_WILLIAMSTRONG_63 [Microbacterium phage WilliamStrong]|nr:hypothetical protein SEA_WILLIAMSTRONG_63 [Microbacterium phage WilliamStrong]
MGKESLRDKALEIAANQKLMREEMEAGVHKPQTLGSIVNDMMGIPNPDEDVRDEALRIINEAGQGLRLSLQQWATVQRMIELGIVSGRAGS